MGPKHTDNQASEMALLPAVPAAAADTKKCNAHRTERAEGCEVTPPPEATVEGQRRRL